MKVRDFFIFGDNVHILDQERVAYVAVAPNGELGGTDITYGGYKQLLLERNPRLKCVKKFGNVLIYEVLNE
jgi:hypothetical protein